MNHDISKNLEDIYQRIEKTARRSGKKTEDIKLVAVSKLIDIDRIKEGIKAGIKILGENKVQEAKDKIPHFVDENLEWHLIGHLQTNKAKDAVKLFTMIHSVDSIKLGLEIDKQARTMGKIMDILVQFNISMEETKTGCLIEEAHQIIESLSKLSFLRIKGLMTIPPYFDDPDSARPYFSELRKLSEKISSWKLDNIFMEFLSMGMTGDFEVAIEEGANIVRIGTAIFGQRG
jgi:PLP dependent protein